jgi:hypothetical protein
MSDVEAAADATPTPRGRSAGRHQWFDRVPSYARLALRGFRRTPGFFVTAVIIPRDRHRRIGGDVRRLSNRAREETALCAIRTGSS